MLGVAFFGTIREHPECPSALAQLIWPMRDMLCVSFLVLIPMANLDDITGCREALAAFEKTDEGKAYFKNMVLSAVQRVPKNMQFG